MTFKVEGSGMHEPFTLIAYPKLCYPSASTKGICSFVTFVATYNVHANSPALISFMTNPPSPHV